jgi:hypothetical protein
MERNHLHYCLKGQQENGEHKTILGFIGKALVTSYNVHNDDHKDDNSDIHFLGLAK